MAAKKKKKQVAFIGQPIDAAGNVFTKSDVIAMAEEKGFVYCKNIVSTLLVLVSSNPQSWAVKKANSFGVPVIDYSSFFETILDED